MEGLTPLEIMLDNMRFYHAEAGKLVEKLIAEGVPQLKAAEGDDPNQGIIEGLKDVLELRKRAGDEAARAAPYMHTRMGYASGDDDRDNDEIIPLAERLKEYERRDALKAAGSNVVELKLEGDQSADPSEFGA